MFALITTSIYNIVTLMKAFSTMFLVTVSHLVKYVLIYNIGTLNFLQSF